MANAPSINYETENPSYTMREAESVRKAVFIGKQATDDTIIVGDDTKEEWLVTDDMKPLSLERCR